MNGELVLSHVIGALRTGRASVVPGSKGDHVSTDCPQCGKEEHFAIRVATGWFICFRCGFRGRVELTDRLVEWRQALRRGGAEERRGVAVAQEDLGELLGASPTVPLWTGEAGKPSQKYLARRGVDRETARRYKLVADRHGCRIWFPFWNEKGETTFFMGRTFVDGVEPKTIEPPASSKPLYGLHVGIAHGQDVFAVEGVFDHFATPLSVAIMGSILYPEQIQRFRELRRRVWVLFDPDAKDKAVQTAKRLRAEGLEACALGLEGTGKDPADLGPDVMRPIVTKIVAIRQKVLPLLLSVHVRQRG